MNFIKFKSKLRMIIIGPLNVPLVRKCIKENDIYIKLNLQKGKNHVL